MLWAMSNMFFATPDLCWSAENPRGLSEHFWWISQQLQGLAIYMGQVRVGEFLHPICFRWSVDCVFSACSYEQGDWKFNSIILLADPACCSHISRPPCLYCYSFLLLSDCRSRCHDLVSHFYFTFLS